MHHHGDQDGQRREDDDAQISARLLTNSRGGFASDNIDIASVEEQPLAGQRGYRPVGVGDAPNATDGGSS